MPKSIVRVDTMLQGSDLMDHTTAAVSVENLQTFHVAVSSSHNHAETTITTRSPDKYVAEKCGYSTLNSAAW